MIEIDYSEPVSLHVKIAKSYIDTIDAMLGVGLYASRAEFVRSGIVNLLEDHRGHDIEVTPEGILKTIQESIGEVEDAVSQVEKVHGDSLGVFTVDYYLEALTNFSGRLITCVESLNRLVCDAVGFGEEIDSLEQ